jgi:hypothetical protein
MPGLYETLGAEYAHILRTLNLLEHTSATQEAQRLRLLDVLEARLDAKRLIEEELLYPLLGDAPAVHEGRAEDRDVRERLTALRAVPPADHRFKIRAEALSSVVRLHLARQEYDLFAAAARALPEGEAADLGERAEAIRRRVEARFKGG